jgi:putative transposase
MGRNPRRYNTGGIYHLTAHGIDDRPICKDDTDRQEFCIRFGRVARDEGWRVYAACLMDTHYHLLVGPTRGRVSEGMRTLNGGYSKAFNARHGRRGALFESRYRDWTIRDEDHFRKTVRYIEENPVAAGIVETVDEWIWTTANESSPLKVSDTWSSLSPVP